MARFTTRQGLIDYCLRALGAPVIEINIDDDQVEDRIDEAIAVFKSINVSKEDESNHELGFDLITYDYMRAYFDFYGV